MSSRLAKLVWRTRVYPWLLGPSNTSPAVTLVMYGLPSYPDFSISETWSTLTEFGTEASSHFERTFLQLLEFCQDGDTVLFLGNYEERHPVDFCRHFWMEDVCWCFNCSRLWRIRSARGSYFSRGISISKSRDELSIQPSIGFASLRTTTAKFILLFLKSKPGVAAASICHCG